MRFFIDYEFKSRILGALMGSMFDRAFRMFSDAFEKRADEIYGAAPAADRPSAASAICSAVLHRSRGG